MMPSFPSVPSRKKGDRVDASSSPEMSATLTPDEKTGSRKHAASPMQA
jgi:hypothetical protein